MSLAVAIMPIAIVSGQSQFGVSILQVTPTSLTGTVGTPVNVQGTIDTKYGSYQVIFGTSVVATGNAEGYYVNANFSVPQIPAKSYPIILRDLSLNVNSTGTPESFQVTIGYVINPIPSQIQEGGSVVLNVSVTAEAPNIAYVANVTVQLPSPLNTEFSKILSLGTSSQLGTANAQITYPSSFPSSTTEYSGTYSLYFNKTAGLGQSQFSVNILNSTSYHRGQTVAIEAIDYQPSQAATLAITSVSSGTSLESESVTAAADGTISATWVVPSNAALGSYNVTITPQGTQKSVLDSEVFSIPGYLIQVNTINLANEVVPQIQVQSLDKLSNMIYNGTSAFNGVATLNLETGPQVLTAFWNGVKVGTLSITVTGNGTFTLQCQLADLKIKVQNENGVALPSVNLAITYKYQPSNGGSLQTGNVSAETNPSGIYLLNSTLTGISYTIAASIYNQVFNAGNNTVISLPVQAQSSVVIVCPNEALTINVVGSDKAAITGANVELVELTNGLFYSATTDSSGSVSSQVTLGTYKVQIYKDNILINETSVQVFGASQLHIICSLYGIQVSVSVVDFFGSPIPNANVTLNGPAAERISAVTKGNGKTTFNGVVGGNVQIVAFPQGAQNNYQAVTLTISKPTSVQIKINNYVALGSLMIPVSLLMTIIIILIAVVLLVTAEIYRRRKAEKSPEG